MRFSACDGANNCWPPNTSGGQHVTLVWTQPDRKYKTVETDRQSYSEEDTDREILLNNKRLGEMVKSLAVDLDISEEQAYQTIISNNGTVKRRVKSRFSSIYSPTHENLTTVGSQINKRKRRRRSKRRRFWKTTSANTRKSAKRSSRGSSKREKTLKFKTLNNSTHASSWPRDYYQTNAHSIVPVCQSYDTINLHKRSSSAKTKAPYLAEKHSQLSTEPNNRQWTQLNSEREAKTDYYLNSQPNLKCQTVNDAYRQCLDTADNLGNGNSTVNFKPASSQSVHKYSHKPSVYSLYSYHINKNPSQAKQQNVNIRTIHWGSGTISPNSYPSITNNYNENYNDNAENVQPNDPQTRTLSEMKSYIDTWFEIIKGRGIDDGEGFEFSGTELFACVT